MDELGEDYLNSRLANGEGLSEWSRAGYHIAVCVYLWHRLYERVTKQEAYFLDKQYFEDHHLNGGFLLMALGMGDDDYLTSLFNRFDLKTRYPYHYHYYYYCIHRPDEPMPRALDVNGRNLMMNVGFIQERYALNKYHYMSTTKGLTNLDALITQVNQTPATDWQRLLALQSLLWAEHNRPNLMPSRFEEAVATVRQTLESMRTILLPFNWQKSYEVHRLIGNPTINYRRYSLAELCLMLTVIYRADTHPIKGFYYTIPDVVESGELLKLLVALERKV